MNVSPFPKDQQLSLLYSASFKPKKLNKSDTQHLNLVEVTNKVLSLDNMNLKNYAIFIKGIAVLLAKQATSLLEEIEMAIAKLCDPQLSIIKRKATESKKFVQKTFTLLDPFSKDENGQFIQEEDQGFSEIIIPVSVGKFGNESSIKRINPQENITPSRSAFGKVMGTSEERDSVFKNSNLRFSGGMNDTPFRLFRKKEESPSKEGIQAQLFEAGGKLQFDNDSILEIEEEDSEATQSEKSYQVKDEVYLFGKRQIEKKIIREENEKYKNFNDIKISNLIHINFHLFNIPDIIPVSHHSIYQKMFEDTLYKKTPIFLGKIREIVEEKKSIIQEDKISELSPISIEGGIEASVSLIEESDSIIQKNEVETNEEIEREITNLTNWIEQNNEEDSLKFSNYYKTSSECIRSFTALLILISKGNIEANQELLLGDIILRKI